MDVIAPSAETRAGVLVVADWRADPGGVIAACRRRASLDDVAFALVVPAWLHGLDWVGDPYASRPCAVRQVEGLVQLSETAGLRVDLAQVGDPDPTCAVDDALAYFRATEILVCRNRDRTRHVLDLSRRLRRTTRLPVETVGIPAGPSRRRRWRALIGSGHCVAEAR